VIYLLGRTLPELGGSEYGDAVLGKVTGRPPRLDLDAEARLHRLLHEYGRQDLLGSGHDLSDGGLAIALAECSIAGGVGFTVSVPDDGLDPHVALFSESASRALVTARPGREADVEQLAAVHQVPITRLGLTGGSRLEFAELFDAALSDAVVVYEGAIPRLMAAHRLAG
jgi:phosphoribosylformylglycinamidine synthase